MPSQRGEASAFLSVPPEPPTLRPAPGRREVALVLGLAFALNVAFGTAFYVFGLRAGLVVTQALALALPPIAALRLFYLERRAVFPFGRPALRHVAAALLGTVGLNHLLTLYGSWQEHLWPQPESLRAMFDTLLSFHGPLDFAWLLASVALAPALCEEILFRGFVQSGLVRQAERPWRGVAATALVFGLFHLDPWRFLMVTALGLFLGWLRQASGSLWPPILAHAFNNLLTILVTSAGLVAADRAAGTIGTALLAAGLVTLALSLGRRRSVAVPPPGSRPSGRPAERVL